MDHDEYLALYNEAKQIANSIHAYINNKEKKMSVLTPAATVETVEIEKTVKTKAKQYTVRLSEQQAGYLMSFLYQHAAGEVVSHLFTPIRTALVNAGARQLSPVNDNKEKYSGSVGFYYTFPYAVLKFRDDEAREAAGLKF